MEELEQILADIRSWDRKERARLLADHSAERNRRRAALRDLCGATGHRSTVHVDMFIGYVLDCSLCGETLERHQ